jgi:hypothetical protein
VLATMQALLVGTGPIWLLVWMLLSSRPGRSRRPELWVGLRLSGTCGQAHMWYNAYVEVVQHPAFTEWMTKLVEADVEVGGEVQALIDALEEHGTALGDPESHPVVTSPLGLRTLRRTPPTTTTPYSTGPPVLRVLYGFAAPPAQPLNAVLLLGGDKTTLGSTWYPPAISEAERRLIVMTGQLGWHVVPMRLP